MTPSFEAIKLASFSAMQLIYQRVQQGLDVSPAVRFRLEGQLQLLLDIGVMSWQEYQDECERQMNECGLRLPTQSYWHWCFNLGDVYLRLPIDMQEAPVY